VNVYVNSFLTTLFRVDGKSIKIRPVYSGKPVPRWLKDTLQKTPFMDPDREQEREEKISRLNDSVRLNKVQFGVYYIVPEGGRAFSYEYTRDCITQDVAWLWMNYDHKVIRIEVGDELYCSLDALTNV
jgi:RNA-dependent RNA polymerase